MYSLAQLRRGIQSPNLFFRELNRLYHRRLNRREYNTAGIDVMNEDWDNLIILDACRYDMFEEKNELPGTLTSRISRGSSTREFLKANFRNREMLDTVYITANPQLYRHQDWLNCKFHEVRHVWQEEGWDESHQTVLPETTTKYAMEAADEFPNKRLLVHYIQPHYPFLTTSGQPFDNSQAFLKPDEAGSWNQVMSGELDVSPEEIWKAYRETLDRALPAVEDLILQLEGKSVVTADHGNMVGDRAYPFPIQEWGHPRGIYTKQLVKVPWLVQKQGERPEIIAESPTEQCTDIDSDVVQERLEDLGYT